LDPIIQDVPRPVHALIFIAPAAVYHKVRSTELHLFGEQAPDQPPFCLSGTNEEVVWFKQTIGHACGLIALLHAVANGDGRHRVTAASPLAQLLSDAVPLDTEARAQLLYDSEYLEKSHMAAALQGSTSPPDPSEPNGYHFICFVKHNGRLWDLEGGWSGPVPRTELTTDEDVLCSKATKDGPGRYLDIGREMGITDFSCVAVCLDR
jgi:ubiquitin carboxyl-terminal hydrolase L3